MDNKPSKSFCCGYSLRSGTLFIGGSLALNAAFSLILLVCLANADFKTSIDDPTTCTNRNYHRVPSFVSISKWLLTILITLNVIQLVINILLIYGTLKDRPRLVYLWLQIYIGLIAANLVVTFLNGILLYSITSSGIYFSLLGTTGYLVVSFYSLMVVNAYHGTMDLGGQYTRKAGPEHGDFALLI